jgi:hypothetical protein
VIVIDPGEGGDSSNQSEDNDVSVVFEGDSNDHTITVESGSDSDGVSIGVRDIIELSHQNRTHVWALDFSKVADWQRDVAQRVFPNGVRATNVNLTAHVSTLHGLQGQVFALEHPVVVRISNYFFKEPTTFEFVQGLNYTVAANSNKFTVQLEDWPFVHQNNTLVLTTNFTVESGARSDCRVASSDAEETSAVIAGSGAVVSVSLARQALLDGVLRSVTAVSLPAEGLLVVESPSFRETFVYDPNIGLLFGGDDPCDDDSLLYVYVGAAVAGFCVLAALFFTVLASHWRPLRRRFRGQEATRIDALRILQRTAASSNP